MMSRTQISLTPELQRKARRRAGELGLSLAQYLRDLVAADLGDKAAGASKPDRSVVFGLGASGESNVAGEKDRMVGEAIAARRPLRPVRRTGK